MKRRISIAAMICGAALIVCAVSLFLYNRWDENRASEAAVQTAGALTVLIEKRSDVDVTVIETPGLDPETPETLEQRVPSVIYEGESYLGVISIPALDLSLPVTEGWSYAKLKSSPCRYTGSAPEGDFVVMAHNYKRHFGNISLLGYGDAITFTDAAGTVYSYSVAEIETVNSSDIEHMIKSDYELTLFTCTYGGTARIAVRGAAQV